MATIREEVAVLKIEIKNLKNIVTVLTIAIFGQYGLEFIPALAAVF